MIILFIILIAFVIACIWISGFRQDHYWRGYHEAVNKPYIVLSVSDILQINDRYDHGKHSSIRCGHLIKKKWIGKVIFDLMISDEICSDFRFYRLNPHFRNKNAP